MRKYDFVDYFPSYESVMLSEHLSTWKGDQVHVTQTAIDANVDRMIERYSAKSAADAA